jgi:hypothetical protein
MSEEYSRDFKSLLMYFETCMVDSCGKIKGCKINSEEIELAKQMNAEGLIEFGRLKFHEERTLKQIDVANGYTHYVRFSDKAWTLAHKFRRERSQDWINRDVEKSVGYIEGVINQ